MSEAAYDAIAEWYDASVRGGLPIHALSLPAFFGLIGAVEGQRVCDLGCGQGIVARELARRGASVTGIDVSARLLEIARENERVEPLGIDYREDDAQALASVADGVFDGVACHLALMDIPDLAACLRAVVRVLCPGGWFVFAVTHPCFQVPEGRWTGKAGGMVRREVRGYFREGFWRSDNIGGVRGQVGAYHRMLPTYMNALIEAGLILERLAEPRAEDEVARRVPGYEEVPAALIGRCRREA